MKSNEKGEKSVLNFLLISFLGYNIYKLNSKIDRNSKIIGSLKISDLDEEFWED